VGGWVGVGVGEYSTRRLLRPHPLPPCPSSPSQPCSPYLTCVCCWLLRSAQAAAGAGDAAGGAAGSPAAAAAGAAQVLDVEQEAREEQFKLLMGKKVRTGGQELGSRCAPALLTLHG
jgi:hypothetical protein